MRKYLKNQTPVPQGHKNSIISNQVINNPVSSNFGFATPASSNYLDTNSINIKQATRFSNGINRANTPLQQQRAHLNRSLVQSNQNQTPLIGQDYRNGDNHYHQGTRVVLNKLSKQQNYSRENLTFDDEFHDAMKVGDYQGLLMR